MTLEPQPVTIGRSAQIGAGRVFVIAEAGINHNGDVGRALEMVDAAAAAGADCVKFQTFAADRLVVASGPKARYQQERTGGGSQRDLLKHLELSRAAHEKLIARCAERGILFLSTPFEEQSADLLEVLGVPAFKIPSGELTNLPFLRHIAAKGRPIILSTGMSTIGEVDAAVGAIEGTGNRSIVLLHCVSQYPAPAKHANLRAMRSLSEAFGYHVGYSDHSVGISIALAAAALGAVLVEKHFTLDRAQPGPDHAASLEPGELTQLVAGIRDVSAGLGDGRKVPQPGEAEVAATARKSLVVVRPVGAGSRIERTSLAALRPGTGISPAQMELVVGRCAARDLAADTILAWSDLA